MSFLIISTGGSRAAATSKMDRSVITVNGFQPLTIISKRSILDVAAVLDPPLISQQLLQFFLLVIYFSSVLATTLT